MAHTAAGIFKAEKKGRPQNKLGKPIYTKETATYLERLWRFYTGISAALILLRLSGNTWTPSSQAETRTSTSPLKSRPNF
jgi:hypothetical protein